MKYKIYLTLFLCFLTTLVFAQTKDVERKWHFGILGGTHIFGETFTYEKIKTVKGAVLGLDLSYKFLPAKSGLSFHVQPNWSIYIRTNSGNSTTYDYKIQSINLPLLLRYTFLTGKIRPFLEAGLNVRTRTSFDIDINGRICSYEPAMCFSGQETRDMHSQTSQDRVGVLAGVGIEFDVWRISIPVSIRFNEGIGTYKMKERFEDHYYYDDIKTRNIQITTGITF
ncbi:PorT family protein [Dyadobacter sp. CY345]|uniref:outer membrane beta-barrel protein n=1 Tax=Dyadobacter sp. CY345 TaxID=2909335 RepID=UPI001F1E317B|nr:outer membrane beta-barrel protein [Dyadobacter sp. CY345]MCF2447587.1 PorT family protein [Dyadobacter sp. CY345]